MIDAANNSTSHSDFDHITVDQIAFRCIPTLSMAMVGTPFKALTTDQFDGLITVDGKLCGFCGISISGKLLPLANKESTICLISALLLQCRIDSVIETKLRFTDIDLQQKEAFFEDLDVLEGALWISNARLFRNGILSVNRLRDLVPTYNLIQGKSHIRVKDCLDALHLASFDDDIMTMLDEKSDEDWVHAGN